MIQSKPVAVNKLAFVLCRSTVAVLLWAAFLFKIKWLVIVGFAIFAASAVLKIKKAPLIVLFTFLFSKIAKGEEILDEKGMFFAHSLGACFSLLSLLFLYFFHERTGWAILFVFAILKTLGALGFCSALQLYKCMASGTCCSFLKKKNG